MPKLTQTIPALPVREITAAVAFYRDRLGFEVLHPVSKEGVEETNFGTREFATLDVDGNLVTFFHRVA